MKALIPAGLILMIVSCQPARQVAEPTPEAQQPASKGRPCPAPATTIGGRGVSEVFELIGFEGETGATDAELIGYSKQFDRSDTDRDGRHSRKEYVENAGYGNPAMRRGIFGAADNNADDYVTRVEYVLNRAITDEAKSIVQTTDANKDGKIARDEFIAGVPMKDKKLAAAVFDALDTNGDGVTTISEYLRTWGGWARPNYEEQEAALEARLKKAR